MSKTTLSLSKPADPAPAAPADAAAPEAPVVDAAPTADPAPAADAAPEAPAADAAPEAPVAEAPKNLVGTRQRIATKEGRMLHLHLNEWFSPESRMTTVDDFTQAQLDAGKWHVSAE